MPRFPALAFTVLAAARLSAPACGAGEPEAIKVGYYGSMTVQEAALAQSVHANLKLSKTAVLYDQTQAYSKALRDDFTRAFKSMGGEIVSDQAYSGGDQDFSAQLTTLRGAKPEIIFIPGYYT